MVQTIVSAFFDTCDAAEKAMQELRRAGVRDAAMSTEARNDARHKDAPGPGNHKRCEDDANTGGILLSVDTDLTAIGGDSVVEIFYRHGGHGTSRPATE
jgi:hypothetical protein